MSKMIQLRNVPDALHRSLKARAAIAGRSLSDYLLARIKEIAEWLHAGGDAGTSASKELGGRRTRHRPPDTRRARIAVILLDGSATGNDSNFCRDRRVHVILRASVHPSIVFFIHNRFSVPAQRFQQVAIGFDHLVQAADIGMHVGPAQSDGGYMFLYVAA